MNNRLVIGSSWKMTKTRVQARDFVRRLREELGSFDAGLVQAYMLPPFTALDAVRQALGDYPVDLGAQDVFWEDEGPYTGEVSPLMLADLDCRIVMLGHSERRRILHETDEMIGKKVLAAYRHGITPLLCVGETRDEQEAGQSMQVLKRQLSTALLAIPAEGMDRVIVLYEPVWAIGQKETAPPEYVQRMHEAVREVLAGIFDHDIARRTRVIYGGSVTLSNMAGLLKLPGVDGCGVSRAAWDGSNFARMILLAQQAATFKLSGKTTGYDVAPTA